MDPRIEDHIQAVADEIATRFKSGEGRLDEEIFGLQERAAQLRAQRDAIRLMPNRAANMKVSIEGHYQCPWCWVREGVHANLRPTASDERDDLFQCEKCKRTLRVSPP